MADGVINVPIEVYEKLQASGRMPETARELERLLEGDLDQYQQETLTMLDTPYFLGDVEIQPLRGLATLAALEAIDSPFLAEPDDTEQGATFTETALTLYIIQGGRDVLKRVMGIRRRLRGVATTEKWAKKDPAMYEKYLARVDQIQSEFGPLEREACEWLSSVAGVTLDECVQLIFTILQDAWSGLGMVPGKADGKIKKKCGSGPLRILRGLWLRVASLGRLLTRLCFSGRCAVPSTCSHSSQDSTTTESGEKTDTPHSCDG